MAMLDELFQFEAFTDPGGPSPRMARSPYEPSLGESAPLSLRQDLIMPRFFGGSGSFGGDPRGPSSSVVKAPRAGSEAAAREVKFTKYQLFVRDVLVRYPTGSAEFDEFRAMMADYQRQKCSRFVRPPRPARAAVSSSSLTGAARDPRRGASPPPRRVRTFERAESSPV